MRDDDALRELFAPLRDPQSVDDGQVQEVLVAAARPVGPARRRPRRRRLALAAISGAIAVTASAIAITAVDQGHPGTFVSQASARELLAAAADATRDDPAPTGWRWLRTVVVSRRTVEGRPCHGCAVERGVVEEEMVTDVWSGPRGESYRFGTRGRPRAIENAELLETAGVLEEPSGADDHVGTHFPPLTKETSSVAIDADFGQGAGVIRDPQTVPDTPGALVRWVRARLERRDRAWAEQLKGTRSSRTSGYTRATDVSSALIDLATSLQLSGRQQAAAFEALAETPRATVVELSPLLAGPNRVGVQIPRERKKSATRYPNDNRVIVFDGASHRVVAEQQQVRRDEEPYAIPFVNRDGLPFTELVDGSRASETRYSPAVGVAGPGLDAEGTRLRDITRTRVLSRPAG